MIVNEKETVVVREPGSTGDGAVAAILIALLVAVVIGYAMFASQPAQSPSTYIQKERTVETTVPVPVQDSTPAPAPSVQINTAPAEQPVAPSTESGASQ
ncbi:MAG: hypothetical protein K2W82_07745 [Candidatus Obscuribacterales bacterium]|nr:hypothetical protein [Candidatus Obscuribacterales bacterium]